LEVVLRITHQEKLAKEATRARKLKRLIAKRFAQESGNWDDFYKEYPKEKRLNSTTLFSKKRSDDSDDDFESQIMRDLENGDGDLHGL